MKVVKFKDGKFGIRKFSFLYLHYVYYDVTDYVIIEWWHDAQFVEKYCKADKETVCERYRTLKDKGTVVRGGCIDG